jgi:uncharacterized membrane protein (DUF373 family)
LELFGQFVLVLIGIEVLHSMKVYSARQEIHLETVLIVAVVAGARKIVVLDPTELSEGALLGIAAMMFAPTLGYYLVRRTRREKGDAQPESKE